MPDKKTNPKLVAIQDPAAGTDDFSMPSKYVAYMIAQDPRNPNHFKFYGLTMGSAEIVNYTGNRPSIEDAINYLLGQYPGWVRVKSR